MRRLELRNIYKTVATAGTRERLTSSPIKASYLLISAEVSNTGNIYIGNADVSATNAFLELDSGQRQAISPQDLGIKDGCFDLSQIWLDTSVNTDGGYFGYYVVEEA